MIVFSKESAPSDIADFNPQGCCVHHRAVEILDVFSAQTWHTMFEQQHLITGCLLYTSPSPRDRG
eukprot:3491640-Rhodomonas_salina.2